MFVKHTFIGVIPLQSSTNKLTLQCYKKKSNIAVYFCFIVLLLLFSLLAILWRKTPLQVFTLLHPYIVPYFSHSTMAHFLSFIGEKVLISYHMVRYQLLFFLYPLSVSEQFCFILLIFRTWWTLTDLFIPLISECLHLYSPMQQVLLCESTGKERVQIFGIKPQKAFEILPMKNLSLILFLC